MAATSPVTQPSSPVHLCGYDHAVESEADDDDDNGNGQDELPVFTTPGERGATSSSSQPSMAIQQQQQQQQQTDDMVTNMELVAHQALTFHTTVHHGSHTSSTRQEVKELQRWLTSGRDLHPYTIMERGGLLLLEAIFAYRPPTDNLNQLAADDACIRTLAAYGVMHRDTSESIHSVLTDWAAVAMSLLTQYQCVLAMRPHHSQALQDDVAACIMRLRLLSITGLTSRDVINITWPHLYNCLQTQDHTSLSQVQHDPFITSRIILRAACDLTAVDLQRASVQTSPN